LDVDSDVDLDVDSDVDQKVEIKHVLFSVSCQPGKQC
jgi:hypothetical protein